MKHIQQLSIFLIILFSALFLLTYCSKEKYVAKQPAARKEVNADLSLTYGSPDSIIVRKQLILMRFSHLMTPPVKEIYRLNDSGLIWFKNKKLISSADTLLMILSDAHEQGLQASWYDYLPMLAHKGRTEALIKENIYDNKQLVTLDVLLTSALYNYAYDIYHGSVDPTEVDRGWETPPKKLNLAEVLCNALQNNSLSETMEGFQPADPQFFRLKRALSELKQRAAESSSVPSIDTNGRYELHDTANEISWVKKKLMITGDLEKSDVSQQNKTIFDEALFRAVKRYQDRNGLKVDGIIGKNTISAINLSIEEMMAKVIVNLERLRWFAHTPDEEHIVVNLADYSLHYHRENEAELNMKVITGTKEDYTPVLKDTLEYLVFNPEWKIPLKIAREEMLPKIKRDTTYLSRNNFVIYEGYNGAKVRPGNVDWTGISEDNFNFRVVQKPGKMNSLGLVKFIFPNHRSIYLHDTPADYLFSRNTRAFSHGCVRLEKPMELAAEILRDQLEFPEMRIEEILESEETTIVNLEKSIPVHFVYYTAWVDNEGILNFREDIYGFDQKQIHEMNLKRDPYILSNYY